MQLQIFAIIALIASTIACSFLDEMYGAYVPLGQLSNKVNAWD